MNNNGSLSLNLSICDREPIHCPGAIQPHGALLVIQIDDFLVSHASANLIAFLGVPAEQALGRHLKEVIGIVACAALLDGGFQHRPAFCDAKSPNGPDLRLSAFQIGRLIGIDIEPLQAGVVRASPILLVQSLLGTVQRTSRHIELCELAVQALQEITGYDRVMAYRFDEDRHGEVIAEARMPSLEPFLGLHYPAADIPPQARKLYLDMRVGAVCDSGYQAVPILPDRKLGVSKSLDLTRSSLRSVSPYHCEYMRNMKTAASLTIGLAYGPSLWGMLVCHHSTPRTPGPEMRMAVDIFGEFASLHLANLDGKEAVAKRSERQAAMSKLVARLSAPTSLPEALAAADRELLDLVEAAGALVRLSDTIRCIGRTPAFREAERALAILHSEAGGEPLAYDDLTLRHPELSGCTLDGSGALILPLSNDTDDAILWFRPELSRTTRWGGDPAVHALSDPITGTISPRTSFAVWQQIVSGRSAAWANADITIVRELRSVIEIETARRTKAELTQLRLRQQEEQRAQSARLKSTIENLSDGIVMFDADGKVLVWNNRYVNMYGMSESAIRQGTSIRDIIEYQNKARIVNIDVDRYLAKLHQDLALGNSAALIRQLRNGRSISVVHNAINGGGWVASHQDITEKIRAEASVLKKAEELSRINMQFEAALTNMSQGICLFDGNRRLAIANLRFRKMYNLTEEDVEVGTPLRQLLARLASMFGIREGSIDELVDAIPRNLKEIHRLVDGRAIAVQRMPTLDGGWVATHDDITAREHADRQIAHLAYHDVLTGLANRAGFKMRGEAALADCVGISSSINLLLIDLDRFKAVNDTFGHAAGDKLLQQVAARMQQYVHGSDILARLGGDEFAIMQIGEPEEREPPISLAARLIEVLGVPYDLDGYQARIGASIGVAATANPDSAIERLMHEADLALYKAKTSGRNAFQLYEDVFGNEADERIRLERELRSAISIASFEIYYQPIVSLGDLNICGMEALIRWNHPTRGVLLPDQFIPLAEETGLIVPLAEFVVRQACLDAATWPDEIKVAVNISPSHIRKRTLVGTVTSALMEAQLSADRLEIEVTETVLLQQDDANLDELERLRSLGISVALDDFGTGFSSLTHVRMFSFNKIKIDKSFIAEITERSDAAAIVCAVTGLARSLDIVTTAEGIETDEQLGMVRAAGCSQGQGYLFGRPRPAAETLALIRSNIPTVERIETRLSTPLAI